MMIVIHPSIIDLGHRLIIVTRLRYFCFYGLIFRKDASVWGTESAKKGRKVIKLTIK